MCQGVSKAVLTDKPQNIQLNYFQQLMHRWSTQLVYNAIHVVHIEGQCNIAAWEQAILTVMQNVGLGSPHFLQVDQVSFSAIKQIKIYLPHIALAEHINLELNKKFEPDEFPFRFFIIHQANHRYYLGVTYNHWISDAYAIRLLLRQITAYYQGDISNLPPLTLKTSAFESLYANYLGKCNIGLRLRELLYATKLFYNAYRLKFKNKNDFHSLYASDTIPLETFTKLKHYCKRQNVSLNDLFIAQISRLMGNFSAAVRYSKDGKRFFGQRDRIAISSIADIRNKANQPLDNVLGQYLSSYTVVISQPEQRTLIDILQEVNRSTKLIKESFGLIRGLFNFKSALWFWDKYKSSAKGAAFFYKYAPIAAGISNINAGDVWFPSRSSLAENDIAVLDYWRVSPTGPLAPLVFSITTFGEQVTVCLVYRSTAIQEDEAAMLCRNFCDGLKDLVN